MDLYEKIRIEVVELDEKDIITTSGEIGEDDGSNDGEWID